MKTSWQFTAVKISDDWGKCVEIHLNCELNFLSFFGLTTKMALKMNIVYHTHWNTSKHTHAFYCYFNPNANWMMCQTDWEPIRALCAQPMAAADTELTLLRPGKKTKKNVKTSLSGANSEYEEDKDNVCMSLYLFFTFSFSAWILGTGYISVLLSDGSNNVVMYNVYRKNLSLLFSFSTKTNCNFVVSSKLIRAKCYRTNVWAASELISFIGLITFVMTIQWCEKILSLTDFFVFCHNERFQSSKQMLRSNWVNTKLQL